MSNPADDSIEDLSKLEAELGTDFTAWKSQISKLMRNNEKYKQENYTLQCKLEMSSTMEQELREVQEVLEKTVAELEIIYNKKIQELEEKHMEEKKDFISRLSEMEAENSSTCEEHEKLQIEIWELKKKLHSTTNETPVIIEEDSALQEEIAELVSQLRQRDHTIRQMDESLQDVNNENTELKEILKGTKQELCEQKEQLENVRDELMELKMELAEVKEKPASESSKGNSLFAEVEDRRKKMLAQMSAMRRGYHEAKGVVTIKDAEIRSLKAEKSALLRKWEDDKVDSHYRDNKLMEKYKERISELELKLLAQKAKYELEAQKTPTENTFSFFQSMLDTKKKEIEELESKLENVSIQAVLEEEMKHKLSRQLRYWRCKAMSSDAQLVAINSHLEADPQSTNTEVLKILRQTVEKQSDFEETLNSTPPPPDVIEESVITLEQLMKVPNSSGNGQSSSHDNSMFDSCSEDLGSSLACFDGSIVKRESAIPNGEDRQMNLAEVEKSPTMLVNEIGEKSGNDFQREMEDIGGDKNSDYVFHTLAPREKETEESNKENKVDVTENNNLPNLKSALVHGNSSVFVSTAAAKKERKTLKFTDDTVDPPPRTLRRQVTPKYPIIFISNKAKKP